ncbi:MAG: hypothetical protein ACYS99_02360 [Planctomycetota bacterium]|jgi:hypothetical protein
MGRPLLLIAAVVGTALLLWWVALSPKAPPPAPEEDPPAEERADLPEVPPPAPEPPPPEPPAAEPAAEEETPGSGFVVSGRVVYVGGDEEPDEIRVVFLRETGKDEAVVVEAEGRGGRFRARFRTPGLYRIDELVVDGEHHDPTWDHITVREGEDVVLRVAKTRPIVLVVTDAINGSPLPGARACSGSGRWDSAEIESYGSWRGRIVHAIPRRESGVRRADAQGRIPVTPGRWDDFAVVAQGYAWAIVDLPRSAGGEIRVELLPGGAVRIRVPRWGDLERPALLVRLEGQTGEQLVDHEVRDGEVRLDGVLAGSHELLVKEGGRDGEVAGKAEVEILPGQESEITIDVDPAREPRVEVTGRVTIPKAWKRAPRYIVFQRRLKGRGRGESRSARLESVKGAEVGRHRYRFEGLTPGTYFVKVKPFQFYREVEVGSETSTLDFALPEPVEVRLRVVGADTAKDLPDAEVLWHSVMEGLGGYGLSGAARAADGRFTFQAPPGPIEVSAAADGYIDAKEAFEARGTSVEREIRLAPGAVLLVRFRVDGEDFSGEGMWCDLKGNGRRGRLGDPEGVRFPNLRPGTYTLQVREIAGFEPVPDRKVEVRPGSNEVVVDLVRKR